MRILLIIIISVIFNSINGQPAVISPSDNGLTSITVRENVPTTKTIFYVMPTNPDWECTVSTSAPFKFTGCKLHTTTTLNYENDPHSYTLHITVTDKKPPRPKTIATRILTVNIQDVLDASPTLIVTPNKVSIDEELSAGTFLPVRVIGRDPETAIGDVITYFLKGSGSTYFNMNPSSGSISVVNRLDYEAGARSFNLVVTVMDKQGHSADATLTIDINDVNDNTPTCAPNIIQTTVVESISATPTTLTKLTCKDKDVSTSLQYSIASGDNPSTPSFDMLRSAIRVTRALDYERKSTYSLIIHVTDTLHTATVTVNVQVLDKNEEPPKWSVSTLKLDIAENHPLGQTFFTCVAIDPDGQPNQRMIYRIVSTSPATRHFHINTPTGELSLLANLDHESKPTSFTVQVQATDGGTPPLNSTSLTLTLNVLDVNDNVPVFSPNQYTFKVKENLATGTSVGSVRATDSDGTSANNVVSYRLSSAVSGDLHHFNVDITGRISTSVILDRESIPVYVIIIKGVDNGLPRLTGTATVTVNVDDVDDSPPEFDSSTYYGSVSENTVVSNVISMTVTDKDTLPGSAIVSIDQTSSIPGLKLSSIFKITRTGKVFTISLYQKVDRESDPSFVFNVFAHDPATPSLTSTATVSINVIDVNEPPSWVTSSPVDISIPEDTRPGTLVYTVSARDGDLGPGGQVRYSLITGTDFHLDSSSGEISTQTNFDYERGTKSYTLTIRATDNGNPPIPTTSYISLKINILDVNDNVPIFTQSSYTFHVPENVAPLQSVGSVSSTDQDSYPYDVVKYDLDVFPQGKPVPFTIRKLTHGDVISTTSRLDRETCDKYTMMIKVTNTDLNLLTSTATVTVIVDDVNDNSPEFDMTSYSGEIREDSPAGTSILKLTVTDKDAGRNGQVSLSVTPSLHGTAFTFVVDNTTGVLSLRVPNVLDREKRSLYSFEVKAVDSGARPLTSSVTVTVMVTDANDNAPKMDQHFYDTQVDYTGVCGNDIVTVTAHDDDIGNNSHLSYFLVDSTFHYLFSIHPATGVFSVKSYVAQNFRYAIEASAKDGGDPMLSAVDPSLIRVDAFNLEGTAITFKLGVDKEAFEANLQTFITNVEAIINVNYTGAILKICCVEPRSGTAVIPTSSRRRLLQASSPVDVHVYVLSSNMSSDPGNINTTKKFLTSDQLVRVLRNDPRGYPVSKLKDGHMSYFHVESVTPYHLKVTPWAETVEGIVIITFIALVIVVFILILIVVISYTRNRRKRPTKQVRPSFTYTPKPPRSKMEVPDIDTIKKHPPPIVTSLPFPSFSVKPLPMKTGDDGVASIGPGFRATQKGPLVYNRKFEGTAVDDATGRVYRYDTRTNKREWVVTPEGRSVTVTHH